MRQYSESARRNMRSTEAVELPLYLLEIDHPNLVTPVRIVQDNQDIVSNGNTYMKFAFEITLPDDLSTGQPKAVLAVDNVMRELVPWLELSNGGRGSTCRIMQVQRSDPDTVEFDITLALSNIKLTSLRMTADLSFDELLNLPAVAVNYNLQTAPGLF
jgi:hypothetical protein